MSNFVHPYPLSALTIFIRSYSFLPVPVRPVRPFKSHSVPARPFTEFVQFCPELSAFVSVPSLSVSVRPCQRLTVLVRPKLLCVMSFVHLFFPFDPHIHTPSPPSQSHSLTHTGKRNCRCYCKVYCRNYCSCFCLQISHLSSFDDVIGCTHTPLSLLPIEMYVT